MTKYTLVPADKIIIKDGEAEIFDDASFWSNYSNINAIQIDTNSTSEKENLNGSISSVTQTEIDAIENKFTSVKTARETQEATDQANYNNSWDRVRSQRNELIFMTDKYLIADFPITSANKTLIENYRTALRNLPDTYSSETPSNITFDDDGNVNVNGTQVITKPSI